ncbi:NACHT domain-containing protein [Ectopseudomonas alcaliphila]|uniref:NACHT domain-containing protein n=1 Tax=Ectopseudomonas alcaliphila TaxID=101564 RepID=UPI00278889ED|nr:MULTISPECIES: NACHT domain-containing protein [Pseudomonas]MDP9940643.1 GTPase SAR1 family protein [Pseudomonas sp. 3400]MDR7011792.1 GTPase SAR1 family protein [Pseudomonas alcaliphila]
MSDFNISEVVSNVVSDLCSSMVKGAAGIGKDALSKLKVNLDTCLREYLERSYERYSKTKTLLYRERPVDIKSYYVRTNLGLEGEIVLEHEFLEQIKSKKRIVVTGTAGSGKSTFCKSIFVDVLERKVGIIPIFIELRHLNMESGITLVEYIVSSLAAIEPSFSRQQLEYALRKGRFLLIFDGFDEINGENRATYEREIIELSNIYHEILVVVSSRPDPRFSSWEEFYRYSVLPLSKEKALSLIGQLEYDTEVKSKFLKVLEDELFEKHKSFASNPLLLTMMLLTYEQIADIPNKIHLFYEQAFLTLFNKHDSLKSLYKRKSFTGLPLDDFKKVLSAFCVLGYAEKIYYFDEVNVLSILEKAIRIYGVNASAEDFLRDLLDSVCILQRDGLGFSFTHRSFQEYFTALFLVSNSNAQKYEVMDKVFFVNDRDSVLDMSYDINSDIVERVWLMPRLQRYIDEFMPALEGCAERDDYIRLIGRMYSELTVVDRYADEEVGSETELALAYTFHDVKNDHAHFFSAIHSIFQGEWRDFYLRHRDKSKLTDECEDELISLIADELEGESIDLSDVEGIPEKTRELIFCSGGTQLVSLRLDYARYLLSKLGRKHAEKDSDISSLILG